jgi:small GTP-binding protein
MATQREQLLKILIVGECGTGKTCLIRQYMHNSFQSANKATIGVDFALKVIPETSTTLQIWDIAGQERYGQMTRVYFLSAVGAMIVAEINKMETYEAAVKWKQDVDGKVFMPGTTTMPIPCILLLNKCDLGNSDMPDEEIDKFCKTHGFVAWFKVSAKTGVNVSQAFDELVRKVQEAKEKARSTNPDNAPDRVDQNRALKLGDRGAKKPVKKESKCPCA